MINVSPQRREERGFSLVISLMLMVLLTLLAVGLLSLSTIEVRSSGRAIAMQEARANARLALTFAIGSLQKHAGPDRRATGPATLGENGSDQAQNGEAHWTGVWDTTLEDDMPIVQREGNGGGLRDRRFTRGLGNSELLRARLVSGEGDSGEKESGQPDSEETLVGPGTLGKEAENDDRAIVRVPSVTIAGNNGNAAGRYAWWVGDLGTKANIATPDRLEDRDPSGIRRLQIAQDVSLAAIDGADLPSADRAKLISPSARRLLKGEDRDSANGFHDFTVDSESVLADMREGGLKKDLTAYLLGNGEVPGLDGASGTDSLGLADNDRIIGPPNDESASLYKDGSEAVRFTEISPTFGLMRHWASRSLTNPLTTRTVNPDYPLTRPRDEGKAAGFGDRNMMPVEFLGREVSDVAPVLAEASIYYNLSHYETSDPDPRHRTGLRLHLYPRVALWNPYNFPLKIGKSMVGMQFNGAKEVEVTLNDGRRQIFRMSWGRISAPNGGYSGARRGSHYFQLSGVTIGAGETIVFSPAENRQYDNTTLSANVLSPELAPDPTRSFYMDKRPDNDPAGGNGEKEPLFRASQGFPPNPAIRHDRLLAAPREWREVVTAKAGGNVQASGYTQADDYWMFWKPAPPGARTDTLADFNRLPHGSHVSCAFQYGDEDELPVIWSDRDPVPMPKSSAGGVTMQKPDRRTRDGFRLRWFREHPSNKAGSGSLRNTAHFDDSPMGVWNMRASYSFRSAFENVTDVAPHFFGIYTRDLFDDAISWDNVSPRPGTTGQNGDPFDQPVSGQPRILFDVPRSGADIVSLAGFQHLKFSELIWHPTYALGNSLADPRVERSMTQPDRAQDINTRDGGWNRDAIGYSTDGRSDNNGAGTASDADNWAHSARGMLEQSCREQNLVFDLSYELNHALWDRYFLSTGTIGEKAALVDQPETAALPNGRLRPVSGATPDDVSDFHRAASSLMVDGGFNVNSTSVEAWEALLLSPLGAGGEADRVSYPRIYTIKDSWQGGNAEAGSAWTGHRSLSTGEVRTLAESIVEEVKLRGPFLSMSDFVNRRLSDDETAKAGALEAAIRRADINAGFRESFPLDNSKSLPNYRHGDNIKDPTRVEQTLKPDTTAWGALGHLTQADLLQALGPVLQARSDTFVVRAYGSSVDKEGNVIAEAWCEAVVQRTPQPVHPDDTGLNPDHDREIDFGRRFAVKRFRWLHRDEV